MEDKMKIREDVIERLLLIYWMRFLRIKNGGEEARAQYWHGKYNTLDFMIALKRPNGKDCQSRIDLN
jgi:hypothetical protein